MKAKTTAALAAAVFGAASSLVLLGLIGLTLQVYVS
jgi:hypothetical protein